MEVLGTSVISIKANCCQALSYDKLLDMYTNVPTQMILNAKGVKMTSFKRKWFLLKNLLLTNIFSEDVVSAVKIDSGGGVGRGNIWKVPYAFNQVLFYNIEILWDN